MVITILLLGVIVIILDSIFNRKKKDESER